MRNTLKIATALGASTCALMFAVTAASAQTTDLVNTGDDVEIDAGSSHQLDVNVDNRNEASVYQSSYSNLNTGGNSTDGNIGGGSINTGNAVAANKFSVKANQNQTAISGLGFGGGTATNATITNTGDDLEFDGGSEIDVDIDVDNRNEAEIFQSATSFLNTGDNDADDNIGGGDIDSGDAGVSNEFDVQVNANETTIEGLDDLGGGNNELELVNTGDDAEIDLGSDYEVDIEVENDNEAFVKQWTLSFLNTGDNDTDDNIGGGDIDSGNALVENVFSVMANANTTEIGLAGLLAGDSSETTAVNTGDDLEIESGLSVETEVEVRSDNESASFQSVITDGQTGDNEADDNIGGGNTSSGNAGALAELLAEMNWNWTMLG